MVAGVRGTSFLLDNSAETITGITWNNTTHVYDIARSGTPLDTRLTLVHTMLATPTTVICHDGTVHALSPRQTMMGSPTTCTPPSTLSI